MFMRDFAEAFTILFGSYLRLLAGTMFAVGLLVAAALAWLPHLNNLVRRL
jgi:hypothetical protein